MGDYESAVADCDAALEADPNLAAAHVARARGECELGEIDQAVLDCDSAIHLDENLIEAYVIRAKARLEKSSEMRTLAEVAECDQAVDDCQKAIDLSKKFKGDAEGMKHAKTMRGLAHELRGSIYQNLRATKKALAEYEQALSLDPYLVSALLRRAVTRSTAEDYAGALNDCNTAISIDSARPEAYSGRGMVYAMKLEFPKAIEDFTQAVSLDRKCAKAYSGRAIVYSAMAVAGACKAKSCEAKIGRPSGNRCLPGKGERVAAEMHRRRHRGHCRQSPPGQGLPHAGPGLRQATNSGKGPRRFQRGNPRGSQAWPRPITIGASSSSSNFELDAAIKDFEEASKLQPDNALIDYPAWTVLPTEGRSDLGQQVLQAMAGKGKTTPARAGECLGRPADFLLKPKTAAGTPAGRRLGPLDKAKRNSRRSSTRPRRSKPC